MFLERLDAPVLNSEYYVPSGNENDMPNCTKYCHDRAQEANFNKNLKLFKNIGINGFPMADKWLEYSNLPTGKELKLGSIACCSGVNGSIHVFFIERVNEDGTCFISDSRSTADKSDRSDRFFRTLDNVTLKVGQIPGGIQGVGELLGFQYLPVNDIRVNKDSSKNQLEILKTRVHCRNDYGLNADVINEGTYVPKGIYNVLETKEKDGYTWCKVEEGYWIAYSKDWANLYLVEEKEKEDTYLSSLRNVLQSAEKDYLRKNELENGLNEINEIIRKLVK